jgi:coenzyme F420-0:L-glutamate ligase/coenzyme F420-1:gamma-L-glutamate ligase
MISFIPIEGIGKVNQGDNLAHLLAASTLSEHYPLQVSDCIVIASKVVAKAQGRVVPFDKDKKDIVLEESKTIVRQRGNLIISETPDGFICANAGVDESNVEEGHVVLLPLEIDSSAHGLRMSFAQESGFDCAFIISDTFGRPWRMGETNVALGYSGLQSFADLRGTKDFYGKELTVTTIAIADEIAGGAELVMHKDSGICAVLVRGLPDSYRGEGRGKDLIRNPQDDLFR